MKLDTLFNPRSVAVIGASADKKKLGHTLMKNLLMSGNRRIYPINPGEKKILGLVCYPSVKNVKDKIDLALIAVPAPVVATTLKECGEKKIPFVTVISAGFKETGSVGADAEAQLKSIAKKYKIHLLGPNCLGLMDTAHSLNASFGGDLPPRGDIALVSQSGATLTAALDWAKQEQIGFSKLVSLGNEAGITENDVLAYLENDTETRVICLYLEAVTDGQRFIRLAKKITTRKPIVVLKAGKTERGLRAVASHTGSLAPSAKVFATACMAGGIVSVDSLDEMFNLIKLFSAGITQSASDWVILTNGGGPSIVASDWVENSRHLRLAALSDTTKKKLRAVLPSAAAVDNPVDIIGDALADRYDQALNILSRDARVGGIIVILTPQKMTEVVQTAELLKKYKNKKSLVAVFIGGVSTRPAGRIFTRDKIANFLCPSHAIRALDALRSGAPKGLIKHPNLYGSPATPKDFQILDFLSAKKLLKSSGIDLFGIFVSHAEDLREKIKNIRYPVAMKIVSSAISHKTDAGGVAVNLKNLSEVTTAWRTITRRVRARVRGAHIDGFVVQPMMTGHEVIVGMKRDPVFGPVIVFGLGGIFVEILQDSVTRLPPLNEVQAKEMILELKSAPVLLGARGEKPVNIVALAKIIVAVSHLAVKHPEIKEIDLNPIFVNDRSATVVDWRIII